MRLEGKTALVTGSSSGIGEAIALRFAREGADVAVHYHRGGDNARRVSAEIDKLGRVSVALGANVGDAAEAERLVRDAHEALGRLDILVNNAGVEIREPFADVSEEHFDLVLDVNFKGAFFAAQAAARLMIAAGTAGASSTCRRSTRTSPFWSTPATRRQRAAAHAHAHDLPGAGAARHHRQRHRPGGDRDADQQAHARRRRAAPRAPGRHPRRPARRARRGRRRGRLPRFRRGRRTSPAAPTTSTAAWPTGTRDSDTRRHRGRLEQRR